MNPFNSHTAGWITLSALLVFAPQLSGCDTSAPSEESQEQAKAAPQTETVKTQRPASDKKTDEERVAKKAETDKKAPAEKEIKETPQAEIKSPLVKRLVITSEVKEREPVELDGLKTKEPVVAFLELKNQTESDSGVVVTFHHEGGQKVGFIELEVPKESPRYRTWARTRNIKKAGEWTAIVTSRTGEELARASFTVEGA